MSDSKALLAYAVEGFIGREVWREIGDGDSSPGFICRSAVSVTEKEETSQNHLALGPQLVNISE